MDVKGTRSAPARSITRLRTLAHGVVWAGVIGVLAAGQVACEKPAESARVAPSQEPAKASAASLTSKATPPDGVTPNQRKVDTAKGETPVTDSLAVASAAEVDARFVGLHPPLKITGHDNGAWPLIRAWASVSQETWDLVSFPAKGVLPPEVVEALSKNEALVDAVATAARMPYCDFGWDRSAGFQATLPHLDFLQGSMRMMMNEARRQIGDEPKAEANDRAVVVISAMYGLANAAKSDGIIISALVGAAIDDSACQTARRLLGRGALSIPGGRRILAALDDRDGEDPYGFRLAIRGERDAIGRWLDARIARGATSADMRKEFAVLPNVAMNADEALLTMSPAELKADWAKASPIFDTMIGLLGDSEASEKYKPTATKIAAGEHGRLGMYLAPSADAIFPKYAAIDRSVQTARIELVRFSVTTDELQGLMPGAPTGPTGPIGPQAPAEPAGPKQAPPTP
ncbi:MAG: hypothetical protein IPK69_08520 [Phycisphaerales bacterium]|nr:MAG: hypothetical protein IPK69_08520 [Phycisphaerales bacterium]